MAITTSIKKNPTSKLGYRTSGRDVASSYKRGGKVKKTGMAKVHKGERVLTKKQAKKYKKK